MLHRDAGHGLDRMGRLLNRGGRFFRRGFHDFRCCGGCFLDVTLGSFRRRFGELHGCKLTEVFRLHHGDRVGKSHAGEDVAAASADLQTEDAVLTDWDGIGIEPAVSPELELHAGPGGAKLDLQPLRLHDLDLCSIRVRMSHGRGEEGQGKEKRKSKENTLQSFRFHRNLLKR